MQAESASTKNASFVVVDYSIYDATNNELFEEKKDFELIVGSNELLKKVEDTIKEMKENEEREIVLEPEEAFGNRNEKLFAVVRVEDLKKHNVPLAIGQYIVINDVLAKIQSINSGRVRLDFNHPLAGKKVKVKVKVKKIVNELKDKIKILANKFFGDSLKERIEIKDKEVIFDAKDIKLSEKDIENIKKEFLEFCKKFISEDLKITFKNIS